MGRNSSHDVGVFIGNALRYAHSIGPVWFGVAYSFGEVAGETRNVDQLAIGATYSGPVKVGFGYHKLHDGGADRLTFLKTSIMADGQLMGAKSSILAVGIRHTF